MAFNLGDNSDLLVITNGAGMPTENSARTVMAWVKGPDSGYSRYAGILSFGCPETAPPGATPAGRGMNLRMQGDTSDIGIYIGSDSYRNDCEWWPSTDAAPRTDCNNAFQVHPDDNWHHLAVTYDGTTLTMYWDGVNVRCVCCHVRKSCHVMVVRIELRVLPIMIVRCFGGRWSADNTTRPVGRTEPAHQAIARMLSSSEANGRLQPNHKPHL